jgi:hypothetical protein
MTHLIHTRGVGAKFDILLAAFDAAFEAFGLSAAMQFLRSNDFGRCHYLAALRL